MNSENKYLSVHLSTWMCGQGLHLKGIELVLFALIWSFALRRKLMFLSEKSLAEVFGCTREQVGRSLALLHKKHLVIRSETRRKHGKQLSPTYDYRIDLDGIGKIFPGIRVIWDKEKKHLNTSYIQFKITGCLRTNKIIFSRILSFLRWFSYVSLFCLLPIS